MARAGHDVNTRLFHIYSLPALRLAALKPSLAVLRRCWDREYMDCHGLRPRNDAGLPRPAASQ
jgi:hypothetical protein